MENSIYVGLSKQVVLRNNLDIIANNIANASTPGFRGQNLLFKEYISDPRGADFPLSFVEDYGQYNATEPGPMQYTGNSLDIALTGPGFIGVQGPDGIAYTRAGQFEMTGDGTLITAAGFPVADAGGAPIMVPPNSTDIHIDEKGMVSNQSGIIGQIMIVEFPDLQKLDPQGNNLYKTDATATPAEKTRVIQGEIEGSNVKPVLEMTRMIDTLRSFQSVHQILTTENERLRTMIQRLTRQG
jgi:flagellar basal-body rod protein FlgF